MDLKRLRQAEREFFLRYPGGFENPEMIQLRKHHQLDRMVALTQESFATRNFDHAELILENMTKIITRSSLISMFEKPKFRDFARTLPPPDRELLTQGVWQLLHADEQIGFEIMLDLMRMGKVAKWSLMTILQAYYRPQVDVFIKPTTAKGILRNFELSHLQYKPTPSWSFYQEFRALINEMKTKVDASLSPYNIAFTGFLMRSMPWLEDGQAS